MPGKEKPTSGRQTRPPSERADTFTPPQSIEDIFGVLLNDIKADTQQKASPETQIEKPPTTTYDEEIQKQKARKEKIANDRHQANIDKLQTENENLKSDQDLKKKTLVLLFILLFFETLIIFIIAFLQGLRAWHFDLDKLTLRIVVVATLTQISAMLTIAVRHLFPAKNGH